MGLGFESQADHHSMLSIQNEWRSSSELLHFLLPNIPNALLLYLHKITTISPIIREKYVPLHHNSVISLKKYGLMNDE